MNPLLLEFKKNVGKTFHGDFFTAIFVADGIILAELALHVAAAEKHRAAAPCSAYGGLLAEMLHRLSRPYQGTHAAVACSVTAVNAAFSWAKAAGAHIKKIMFQAF